MDWLPHLWQSSQEFITRFTQPANLTAYGVLLGGIGTLLLAILTHRHQTKKSKKEPRTSRTKAKTDAATGTVSRLLPTTPTESTAVLSTAQQRGLPITAPSAPTRSPQAKKRPPRDVYREAAQQAAGALTDLSRQMHWMTEPHLSSKGMKSSHKEKLTFIATLAAQLGSFHQSAKSLNGRLEKLDISWSDNDPREVMYACANPLDSLYRRASHEEVIAHFEREAARIVVAIRRRGYFVWPRQPWGKEGPSLYELTDSASITREFTSEDEIVEIEDTEPVITVLELSDHSVKRE